MFMALVAGYKVAPSEFWEMTVSEVALFFEAKRPAQSCDYAGSLDRGAVEELAEWMKGNKHEPATA